MRGNAQKRFSGFDLRHKTAEAVAAALECFGTSLKREVLVREEGHLREDEMNHSRENFSPPRRPHQRLPSKAFTDTRIHPAPDCAITCMECIC